MKTLLPSTHILGCSEITVSYKRPLFQKMVHIKGSEDADTLLRNYIDMGRIDLKEFFWIILLSHANRVLGISEIGSGTPKGVVTNIQEIFQLVLLTNATGLIVAHNHPSGNLKPSHSDREVTKKLQKLSKLIDATLVDHIIITSESYLSFSDTRQL